LTNAARKADAMSWSQTMNNYSRPKSSNDQNNWGQIMINFLPSSSLSEPEINCALTPILPGGVAFNLHQNDYIIEQLSIRPLASLNEHFDLVIARKYLIAKEPEWHVLYRSTLHLQDLKNLQSVLDQLLLWEA
jgi:hypothetical protein